jgi:hypothetical protein
MRAPGEDSPVEERPAAGVHEPNPGLRELVAVSYDTGRGILEAEEALGLLQQRSQSTGDKVEQGELAAQELDHVERQLNLARERRRQLDSVEGKLWARRNRLERFLIRTRGSAWWHARPKRSQAGGATSAWVTRSDRA